jgi:class 3 adenylate cyclase
MALVAFFDLRGFTAWSLKQSPDVLQRTIENLEIAFQNAFLRSWCHRLFSKGTGDGLMVVSEAGNFGESIATPSENLQPGHCRAFCIACAQTVEAAGKSVPEELAVGCGITLGEVTQLYLLGRPDYIGSPVNDASKIQAIAYGEVCIATKVIDQLRAEGFNAEGKVIPGKGSRIETARLFELFGA